MSGLKFLLDENAEARIAGFLTLLGHDITRIGREYPAGELLGSIVRNVVLQGQPVGNERRDRVGDSWRLPARTQYKNPVYRVSPRDDKTSCNFSTAPLWCAND